jgi:peptide/nickel transport system permease protein
VFGPLFFPADPNAVDYAEKLRPPGAAHLLGTDNAGRDMLARTIVGTKTSLGAAMIVFTLTTLTGLAVGLVAGFAGGWLDTLIARIIDVFLGLPTLVLALAIVGALGPSLRNLIIAMTFGSWAYLARIARSLVLGARNRPDVIAARLAGVGGFRIALGHVIPGVVAHLLIAATIGLGLVILDLAALSFLGLGAQPPTAEWGQMLADSRFEISQSPWMIIGPGLGIVLAVAAATLISDALRDIADPTRRAL